MVVELVLYSRLGCHLCEQMQAELAELGAELAFALRVEDVDRNAAWRAAYGNEIPVLTTVDGREICRHVLDPGALRAYLAAR
ncbi:MAG: glutaredoxin family protein [Nevskiales bacterium]